ncbi:MAG TPA: alcohol dehydrogenase catalytic domain-containing protein [Nitrososphaerales archaeon]|nr:alcohol dehydrogenase catalytic domain-containing protein [Nitrososphaerales archaeon]
MKAALVGQMGGVALEDVPEPTPAEGEILVKLRCCGVCGTDLEKVQGVGITTKILGHEAVGEVEEVGKGVTNVSKGTRVFAHHHVPCLSCEICKRGKLTYCLEFAKHNLVPCGLAESFVVPRFNVDRGAVIELPEGLGYEEASFIEPLSCCILGLENARSTGAKSAVIYGAGPVGLMIYKLLKHAGVEKVAVGDVSEYRSSFSRKVGCELVFDASNQEEKEKVIRGTMPDGPELVVVATASVAAFEDATRLAARGGAVLLFGAPKRGATGTLDLARLFLNGTSVVTSYASSERETRAATRLLADKAIEVTDLITHRFPLSDSKQAFAAAGEQQCMKALITD